MVHSFPCREESMQNKYGLLVYFACGFCSPRQAAAVVDYIGPATLCKKVKKLCRNWCRNHENVTKMAPQIDPKSMKNRGCVADAFLGAKNLPHRSFPGYLLEPFGDHFRPKIEKVASKKACKNRYRKNIENVCQKAPKSMPKWTPKALIFHTLSKKAKTLQTLCFPT